MLKNRGSFIITLLLITIPVLACGSVGVYNPEATQLAMQGTVTALQATITAMEDTLGQTQTNQSAESQIVVITATTTPPAPRPGESDFPSGSATIIPASSLEQTIQLTSTPIPSPLTITEQDQVITLVATFTSTPTPKQHNEAPIIIDPAPGMVVVEGREILLHWGWNGFLREGEYFDIKLKPDGQDRSAYVHWEQGQSHTMVANLAPGRYWWSVQVIEGYYQNSSSNQPEDRVFTAFTSPESEPRLIIVAEKEKVKNQTPTATTERPDLDENDTPNPEPTANNN